MIVPIHDSHIPIARRLLSDSPGGYLFPSARRLLSDSPRVYIFPSNNHWANRKTTFGNNHRAIRIGPKVVIQFNRWAFIPIIRRRLLSNSPGGYLFPYGSSASDTFQGTCIFYNDWFSRTNASFGSSATNPNRRALTRSHHLSMQHPQRHAHLRGLGLHSVQSRTQTNVHGFCFRVTLCRNRPSATLNNHKQP